MKAFDHKHYVPSLRCKQGEYAAFKALDKTARAGLTPLWEVQPFVLDDDEEGDIDVKAIQKRVDDYLSRLTKALSEVLVGSSCFLDAGLLDSDLRHSSGQLPLNVLVSRLDEVGADVVPVTGPDRDAGYNGGAVALAATRDRGLCLRLGAADISNPRSLVGYLEALNIAPQKIDIIVDLKFLEEAGLALTAAFLPSALNQLTGLGAWRTVTLLAGSFPVDFTSMGSGLLSIPRREWSLWTQLLGLSNEALSRLPTFGDFGVSHPVYRELPPVATGSAAIRYTGEDEWLVFRGRSVRDSRFGGYAQYHALSRMCVSHPVYRGPDYSDGDKYIMECSKRDSKPGNNTTWRYVGTNQHLTFVAMEVSKTP